MSSFPPPLLLSLLNKVRRQSAEKTFVTWLVVVEKLHNLSRIACLCVGVYLVFQVWKIYCGWELMMSSFWTRDHCVSACVCAKFNMCMITRDGLFEAAWITCGCSCCMHAHFLCHVFTVNEMWASPSTIFAFCRISADLGSETASIH